MRTIVLLFSLLISSAVTAQEMTNQKIQTIIESVADSIQGQKGQWQFYVQETAFVCLTDSINNRMRIISPIIETSQLSDELKDAVLMANFHTALDVKYAVADGILWSAFIHPLRELSDEQVKNAIAQVFSANITFGTTFSSTNLVFPGAQSKTKNIEKKESKKRKF